MFKRKWMVLLAASAALVAVGAGVLAAGAQSQDGTGSSFLDRVAAKLGIDTPKLEQAIRDTRSEDIDKAVADGKLTQQQADALKQRLQDAPLEGPHALGGGFEGKGFRMEFRGGPGPFGLGLFGPGLKMGDAQQKLADFLGVSVDDLKTELSADNATITSVAEAHGKSRDDLKAFIRGEAEAQLKDAVSGGKLTQQQSDDMLSMLDQHIDMLLDAPLFGHGPGRFFHERHDDGDDDDGDGGGTPAPQQGGSSIPGLRRS